MKIRRKSAVFGYRSATAEGGQFGGVTDDEEFTAEMRAALMRAMLNPDHPIIKTTEEADALHDDFMVRLWGFVFDMAPREAVD